jgi:hypothetical protein
MAVDTETPGAFERWFQSDEETEAEYLANLQKQMAAKRQEFGGEYESILRHKLRTDMENRYRQEVGLAEGVQRGMETGETSQAIGQQRLALGQAAAQQAAAAVGNPLAARQAMFAGGQQAGQVSMQGATGRAAELQQGRAVGGEAQMRQIGYGQQMESIEAQRRRAIEQAAQAAVSGDIAAAQRQAAATTNMAMGITNAAAGAGAALAEKKFGK